MRLKTKAMNEHAPEEAVPTAMETAGVASARLGESDSWTAWPSPFPAGWATPM